MSEPLTEFLLARIAEDETVAKAALRPGGGPVYADKDAHGSALLAHVGRHDPARVLAECEAKRRIVEECGPESKFRNLDVLQFLALPYADHDDYREEWKP